MRSLPTMLSAASAAAGRLPRAEPRLARRPARGGARGGRSAHARGPPLSRQDPRLALERIGLVLRLVADRLELARPGLAAQEPAVLAQSTVEVAPQRAQERQPDRSRSDQEHPAQDVLVDD